MGISKTILTGVIRYKGRVFSVNRNYTGTTVWLRTLFEEIKLPQMLPTLMQEDNQATIALSENPHWFHRRSRHFLPKLDFT